MFWIAIQQPVSISINIGNSTTINENLFCIKIPAHVLVYNEYKYTECSFPRKYVGKYIILHNEDVNSESNVEILFTLIHISGHLQLAEFMKRQAWGKFQMDATGNFFEKKHIFCLCLPETYLKKNIYMDYLSLTITVRKSYLLKQITCDRRITFDELDFKLIRIHQQ